ncbi:MULTISPECIES: VCBS repeat-containing protein [Streptomyces]|uniref:FG-GAP repeat domain-containing protein n=1 Tax=Streptomyces TaxID=1883 RepID=UPI000467A397|nr:VCBS repeat-containing protein [Streptomyces exfoliatus]
MNIIRRRALKGALVATAVAVATATVAGTASAAPAELPEPPLFDMYGVHKTTQDLTIWFTTGSGGFDKWNTGDDAAEIADIIDGDNNNDGISDSQWTVLKDGQLIFFGEFSGSQDADIVGRGWNTYKTILSPGNIGGAKEADLVGVDKTGVLYSYLTYPNGTTTARVRVGGGWNVYDQVAGQGDLTGDGKPDIVAKEKSTGYLYLYKGTGNWKAPFSGRTKIGQGWNAYDRLIAVGDLNLDGKVDLLARKPSGALMRYYGTGIAATPFKAPTQIGTGYQAYNLL